MTVCKWLCSPRRKKMNVWPSILIINKIKTFKVNERFVSARLNHIDMFSLSDANVVQTWNRSTSESWGNILQTWKRLRHPSNVRVKHKNEDWHWWGFVSLSLAGPDTRAKALNQWHNITRSAGKYIYTVMSQWEKETVIICINISMGYSFCFEVIW